MASVLVQINLTAGSVTVSGSEDGEICELRLKWRGNENGLEGFYVVENSFESLLLQKDMFITITDLAAEIFLHEIIHGIGRIMGSTDIQYTTEHGVRLSGPVFMPPCVINEDDVEEFVSAQAALSGIWGEYRNNRELDVQHIDTARKDDVLFDFVSLLNFERFILVTQLERSQ